MRHGRRPATDAETALWLKQNVRRIGECRLWLGPFSGGYPSITWKQKKMARPDEAGEGGVMDAATIEAIGTHIVMPICAAAAAVAFFWALRG